MELKTQSLELNICMQCILSTQVPKCGSTTVGGVMKDLSRRNNFSYHSSTNYWRWSICFWDWIDYRGKVSMLYQPGAQPHRGETTGDSAGQDGWKGEKAYLWPTLLHSGQDIRCFNIQLFKTGFWLTTWAPLWLDQLCEGAGGQTGEELDPTLKTFKPGVNVPLPEEIFKVDIKEESPAWGFIFLLQNQD